MSDALSAILAIPPAIDAAKNIIASLMPRLAHNNGQNEVKLVDQSLTAIVASLVHFTEFTESLRKWKEVHYITQVILFGDLNKSFSLIASGRQRFTQIVATPKSGASESMRTEFDHLLRDARGAVMRAGALSKSDLQLEELPPGLNLQGDNWVDHIRILVNKAASQLSDTDYGSLFGTLSQLSTDCTLLNISADTRLKEGLAEITRIMHEAREKTKQIRSSPSDKSEC